MDILHTLALIAVAGVACTAGAQTAVLAPHTAIPISFTKTVDASRQSTGSSIYARTTQPIKLNDGSTLHAGAEVIGHVVNATPFLFDKTPYARQTASVLTIRFDTLADGGRKIPLHVTLRAMAGPVDAWETGYPQPASDGTIVTNTQIGGDQVIPSHDEVRNGEGDVVGYNRRSGIYAHLIAAHGNSSEGCDGSDTEQAMGVFSASACGLYGFAGITLESSGRSSQPAVITLSSQHRTASIHAHSAALLEELSQDQNVANR